MRRLVTFFIVVAALVVLLYTVGGVKSGRPPRASLALEGSPSAPFTPLSTSFPSVRQGWVLGTARCSVRPACVQLRSTRDGGATWALETLPKSFLTLVDQRYQRTIAALNSTGLTVRFANPRDGWIYGTIENFDYFGGITTSRWLVLLWSTHDGGSTWRELHPSGLASGGPIYDLEVSRRDAYLLGAGPTFTAVLERTPLSADHWSVVPAPQLLPPAGGSNTSGSIVLNGDAGWLVEGNDRGITGSLRLDRAGRWTTWSPPCASVGDSYVVPVASDALHMVVVCEIGGVFAQTSTTARPGRTPGSWWLYASVNAGSSFKAVRELHGVNGYFAALASPSPGVSLLLYDLGSGLELVMSRSSGQHLHVVFHGAVSDVHFINSRVGVAIAQSGSGASEMIVTHDGGRTWSIQRFRSR